VLLPLARLEHVRDTLLDPLLLAGEDVDERISSPHQMLDVLVHPAKLRLALDILGDLLRLAGQRHRGGRNSLFGAPKGSASRGVMDQKRLARALRRGQTS